METNIRLLVEEQLKLPSGQNLWKAFQFWENQHPELGFQFEFTLTSNPDAEVALKNLRNSFEGKQIFCFEILINKLFSKKLKPDQILNENMLYRPCLIKLVDSDRSEKWEYHLREQELPFFITLAHEFLHALNQLERINVCWNLDLADECYMTQDVLTVLGSKISMQDFLAQKLHFKDDVGILKNNYLNLWGNKDNDDFLDEMTVILGSRRLISTNEITFIGETTFLQEYYHDKSIISWSHYSTDSIKFWEKMVIILEESYVNEVLKSFSLKHANVFCIKSTFFKESCTFSTYKIKRSEKKKTLTKIQTYLNSQKPTETAKTFVAIVNVHRVGTKIFAKKYIFEDTKIIKLLPKYFELFNQ